MTPHRVCAKKIVGPIPKTTMPVPDEMTPWKVHAYGIRPSQGYWTRKRSRNEILQDIRQRHTVFYDNKEGYIKLVRYIPLSKFHLALPIIKRRAMYGSGDEAQSGDVITGALLATVQAHLMKTAKEFGMSWLHVAVPSTSVITTLTLLIRAALRGDMTDVSLAAISFGCSLYALYVALEPGKITMSVETLSTIVVKHVMSLWRWFTPEDYSDIEEFHDAYSMPVGDQPQSSSGVGGQLNSIMKVSALCMAVVSDLCGSTLPSHATRLNSVINLANSTETVISGFLQSFFGLDMDGTQKLRDAMQALETKGQELLNTPSQLFIGPKMNEAVAWKKAAESLLRTIKTPNSVNLSGQVAAMSKKISDLEQQRATNVSRPVPASYLFYGPPGHGKTESVKYLTKALDRAFGTQRENNVYNLNSGKHFRALTGEQWAVHDEFAANRTIKENGMDPASLNNIISGGQASIPGANIEAKSQIAAFNGVFLISNRDPGQLDLGLTAEATTALRSRLRSFRVIDPSYIQDRGRNEQPHRQPDFSHLQFEYVGADNPPLPHTFLHNQQPVVGPVPNVVINNLRPRAQPAAQIQQQPIQQHPVLTMSDMIKLVISDIKRNQESHAALTQAQTNMQNIPDAGFTLWTPDDIPQCGTTLRKVNWLSGPPGCGKTQTIIPLVRDIFTTAGIPIYDEMKYEDEPGLYILDDQVDVLTLSGQRAFADFYDRLHPNAMVLVVSNYGAHSSLPMTVNSWAKWFKRPEAVPTLYQAFPRRSSIGSRYHHEFAGSTLENPWEKMDVSQYVLSLIRRFYEVNHLTIVHGPYTGPKPDFDIDVHVPARARVDDVIAIFTSAALPLMHKASSLAPLIKIIKQNSHNPIQVNITRCMEYMQQHKIPLNMRVIMPSTSYVYVDGTCYIDGALEPMIKPGSITSEGFVIRRANDERFITRQQVMDVQEMTFVPQTPLELFLVTQSIQNTPDWNTVKKAFPPSYKFQLQQYYQSVKKGAKNLFLWALSHPLMITMLVILACVLKYLFKGKVIDEGRCSCNTTYDHHITDFKVDPTSEIIPYADCPQRGGKKNIKSRQHKFHHFRSLRVGDKIIYDDDEELDQQTERVFHGLKMLASSGHTRGYFSAGNIKYTAHWDDDDGRWHVMEDEICQTGVLDSKLVKAFASNIVRIVGENGKYMHATCITPYVAIIPAHATDLGEARMGEYQVQFMHVDKKREIAAIRFLKAGKVSAIPGVKDISRYILPVEKIRSISQALLVRQRPGQPLQTHSTRYQHRDVAVPFGHFSIGQWGIEEGVSHFGHYSSFYPDGDCGMPIVGLYDDHPYIIGVHACKRTMLRTWASVVVSAEAWQIFHSDVPQDGEVGPDGVPYKIADAFAAKMTRSRRAHDYDPSGAVSVLGYVNNPKPMDSKCHKIKYDDFPETTQNFDIKDPVLLEHEIYVQHPDKIPEDSSGKKHPFLIRSKRLEDNYYRQEMQQTLTEIAVELAEHYKIAQGTELLEPLTQRETITGSYQATGIDLSTSAGVCMRVMYGKSIKDQLVEPCRQKIIPEVKSEVDKQLSYAHRGIRYSFPADANYKAELLPSHKTWKKRVFYNVPFPTIINCKRYIAPVQDAFSKMGASSPFQFAMYPLRDWHALGQDLIAMSRRIVSLDVSAYDHSLNGAVIKAVGEFTKQFYSHTHHTAITTLFSECAFMPIIFKSTVVDKQGGFVSGAYGTSYIDSIGFLIMLAFLFRVKCGGSVPQFLRHVNAKICGDDCIFAVHPLFSEQFNGLTLVPLMREHFGMKLTPAEKDEKMVAYTGLEDASFCSRKWVELPEHPSFTIPCLKTSSLYGALTYSQYLTPEDRYEQYIAVRPDIYAQGEETWGQYERELASFARSCNISHEPVTFRAYTDHVFDVVCEEHDRFKRARTLHEETTQVEKVDSYLNHHSKEMAAATIKAYKLKMAESILRQPDFDHFEDECEDILNTLSDIPQSLLLPYEHVTRWKNEKGQETFTYSPNSLEGWVSFLGLDLLPNHAEMINGWRKADYNTRHTGKHAYRFNVMKDCMLARIRSASEWKYARMWVHFQLPELKPKNDLPQGFGPQDPHWRYAQTWNRHDIPQGGDDKGKEVHQLVLARKPQLPISTLKDLLLDNLKYAQILVTALIPEEELHVADLVRDDEEDTPQNADQEEDMEVEESDDESMDVSYDTDDSMEYEEGDVPQSGREETPVVAAPTAVTGATGGAVMDPLQAPSMTVTPAVQQVSQPVTSTEQPAAPAVLQTAGGLQAEYLPVLGYADNILRLCNQFVLTKSYAITTSTARGTVLDDIPFNPWDTTVVSEPIARYGKLHALFSGALEFELTSYSASTIIGSVIMGYVPPNFAAEFEPTIVNMTALQGHVTLDLKEPGSCTLSMTGGNIQDAAVSRRFLSDKSQKYRYGRIIVMAYTNIYNAYDQTVEIPMYRSSRLGDGAYFSEPAFFSFGDDTPDKPVLAPGPIPGPHTALVVDGGTRYSGARDPTLNTYVPHVETGDSTGQKGFPVNLQGDSGLRWEGTAKDEYEQRKLFFTFGSSFEALNPQYLQSTYKRAENPSSTSSDGQWSYTVADWVHEPFSYDTEFWYDGLLTDIDYKLEYGGGPYAYMRAEGTDAAGHFFVKPENNKATDLHVRAGKNVSVDGAQQVRYNFTTLAPMNFYSDGANPPTGRPATHTYDKAVAVIKGTPVCTKVLSPLPETTNTEYKRLLFADDSTPFIPAVLPSLAGHGTMPFTRTTGTLYEAVRGFLHTQNIRAYTYDIVSQSGVFLGTMLFNEDGVWCRVTDPTMDYMLYDGQVVCQNYQVQTSVWPTISYLDNSHFTPRKSDARTFVSRGMDNILRYEGDINTPSQLSSMYKALLHDFADLKARVSGDIPQAGLLAAALGGGLLSGVGSGLSSWASMHNSNSQLTKVLGNKSRIAKMEYDAAMQGLQVKESIEMAKMGYSGALAMRGTGGLNLDYGESEA